MFVSLYTLMQLHAYVDETIMYTLLQTHTHTSTHIHTYRSDAKKRKEKLSKEKAEAKVDMHVHIHIRMYAPANLFSNIHDNCEKQILCKRKSCAYFFVCARVSLSVHVHTSIRVRIPCMCGLLHRVLFMRKSSVRQA